MSEQLGDEAKTYAVRIMPLAYADILQARTRIAAIAGEKIADDWQEELEEAISHLATSPMRPLAIEATLFPIDIRAFTFRRVGSQVAYRVLFTIKEEALDGPQVWIVHIRHASSGPMQPYEVRIITAALEDLGETQ